MPPKAKTTKLTTQTNLPVMNATSAGIDQAGKTYIIVYWVPVPKMGGYNLYRTAGDSDIYGESPLNGKVPIRMVKTANEFKRAIPFGSPEWNMLADGFTEVAKIKKLPSSKKTGGKTIPTKKSNPPKVKPDSVFDNELDPAERALFRTFSDNNLRIRCAEGLAWYDYDVVAEQHYKYELRGINATGREVVLAKDVPVWAGHFQLPDPPSGITLTSGDGKVLALWNRNPFAWSYAIQRSQSIRSPFTNINAAPIRLDIQEDLKGNQLHPPQPGFLDFQHWTLDGNPEAHNVNGTLVNGPVNGITYHYRVASLDILNRMGKWSLTKDATPSCSTPPRAPQNLRVIPGNSHVTPEDPPTMILEWDRVGCDILQHNIKSETLAYHIFRGGTYTELEKVDHLFDTLPNGRQKYLIITIRPDPTGSMPITWTDDDQILLPEYGETEFYYRIICEDPNGNRSSPSAIVSNHVPDTRAPAATMYFGTVGFYDHIRVQWFPNPESDLAGYQIFRGICDQGICTEPCPDSKDRDLTKIFGLVLVGSVPLADVQAQTDSSGHLFFDDHSLPPGSPLCYAYWVRAYDRSQNLYPDSDELTFLLANPSLQPYVCGGLIDVTPPPPPVITTLKARGNAIFLEWIAAPVQDLFAFNIYRSDEEYPSHGNLTNIGTYPIYPGSGGKVSPCTSIPAELDPAKAKGCLLDSPVEPNRVYWYRVSAIDWWGNESEHDTLCNLPASSTFTYASNLPQPPYQVTVGPVSGGQQGLVVKWNPAFSSDVFQGFVVFRRPALENNYRQVSGIVQANQFVDKTARPGISYHYRVQAIDINGRFSEPSSEV